MATKAISLIFIPPCYIILRNVSNWHLANRPLNWYVSCNSLNKRHASKVTIAIVILYRTTWWQLGSKLHCQRNIVLYSCQLLIEVGGTGSLRSLSTVLERQHCVMLIRNKCALTTVQEINTEYRRERWHSDSKEDTRLYQTYSKGIIGSVYWLALALLCVLKIWQERQFLRVQPAFFVSSTLSGPLRRIIASSRLLCKVTRPKAKPVIKA